jgi:transposase
MKRLAELNALNLDVTAHTRVAALVQSLIEEAQFKELKLQQTQLESQSKDLKLHQAQQEAKAKDLKIQALTLELATLRRIRYGVKSEALSREQLDLFQEASDEDLAAVETEVELLAEPASKPKRQRAGRQPLPAHLPRIEHRHEPTSCQCGQCGAELVKIREDITEQLDVEPAKFFVHRHIRPQYACRCCETVTAAPVSPAIIDSGMAAPGLLTWILVSKYLDHLPLYRLEQIAARGQVSLPRSTLADWVGRSGVALKPLAERLQERLLNGDMLHADETPVAQLDPGSGKTKKAYLWAYRSNDLQPGPKIMVFDYQSGRSGVHAQHFLGTWHGHLLVDDYAGYKALFTVAQERPEPCTELACMAHVRRKFFDLYQSNASPMAQEALTRIGLLYAIEQQAAELTIEARQQLRAERSLPALDALHAWLIATRVRTANGGGSAKALDYALKRWPSLVRYAHSGHLPIDNNPVENAIRPIAVGKKNWLFTGSERAGQRAAVIQTLLGTAKLNGLDPTAWLKDTLEKLPVWPNSRIDELLPFPEWNSGR